MIKILELRVFRHHIDITYQVGTCHFSTKIFYHDVNLDDLSARYSPDSLRQIFCHIALFEGLKYCSVFPAVYDLTAISDGLFPDSITLFTHTYQYAYTQNMYENNVSSYNGPEMLTHNLGICNPITPEYQSDIVLAGNGGGKDSFLSMKILEESGLPFSSFQWARSEYGRFEYQHKISSGLLKHLQPREIHRVSIYDDFTDGTYVKLYYPELSGAFTLGTPECIFEALPIILDKGYRYLCFGNEKSSDVGNFYWAEIGREVNHQWVKSYDAETLFDSFIHNRLIRNFRYFSILKPIYDFRIFNRIGRYPNALPDMHSCNIDKPWCKKCPKCAYVWLGYLANFDPEAVKKVFGDTNPFDDPDLLLYYKQLLGIESHKSFECVGTVDESRFFMKKCSDKGLQGKAITIFKEEILSKLNLNWAEIEKKYDTVDYFRHNIPDTLFTKMKEYF